MNEIIKKIDERIAIYKEIQENLDLETSIAYQNIVNGIREAKQIILSSQKESEAMEKATTAMRLMPSAPCGIIQGKPLTIGDKIRESNESLAGFIKGQFGDDRVFVEGEEIDIEDYLNQPVDAIN